MRRALVLGSALLGALLIGLTMGFVHSTDDVGPGRGSRSVPGCRAHGVTNVQAPPLG